MGKGDGFDERSRDVEGDGRHAGSGHDGTRNEEGWTGAGTADGSSARSAVLTGAYPNPDVWRARNPVSDEAYASYW